MSLQKTGRSSVPIGLAIVAVSVLVMTGVFFAVGRASTSSPDTVSIASTSAAMPCKVQIYTNSTLSSDTPVLLMRPNSTGFICVTYQSAWQGNANQNTGRFFVNSTQQFDLSIGHEHCSTIDDIISCTGGTPSRSFAINAFPSSIQPTMATDYVTVIYTVTALSNSTGFYDYSAPYGPCDEGVPMAVGYSASQVNSSDFTTRIDPQGCFPLAFTPVSVSVGGMSITNTVF